MLIVLIPSLHDFQLFNEKMYLIYKLAIIIFQIILQKCEWFWYVCERGINFLFVHLSASLGVLSWCNFRKFQSGKSAKSVVFILLPKSKPFYFHIITILTSLITWTLIWADQILFWAISLKKNTANLFRIQQYGCLYLTSSLQCQPICLKMSNYRSHSPFIWRFRTQGIINS